MPIVQKKTARNRGPAATGLEAQLENPCVPLREAVNFSFPHILVGHFFFLLGPKMDQLSIEFSVVCAFVGCRFLRLSHGRFIANIDQANNSIKLRHSFVTRLRFQFLIDRPDPGSLTPSFAISCVCGSLR